jgi:hypothetical protein
MIYGYDVNTVKSAQEVTSIKQSPVLKDQSIFSCPVIDNFI